jgi:hypothetical protein
MLTPIVRIRQQHVTWKWWKQFLKQIITENLLPTRRHLAQKDNPDLRNNTFTRSVSCQIFHSDGSSTVMIVLYGHESFTRLPDPQSRPHTIPSPQGKTSQHKRLKCVEKQFKPISSSSSYIAIDGQLANPSWCRVPFGANDQNLIFFVWQLLSFFFMWGALSDERTGL